MDSVIVVLGKGVNENGTLTKESEKSVKKAVEIFKSSGYDAMVMSGRWAYSLDYVPIKTESEAMKEYAVKLGVPEKSIYLEKTSLDTLGNAYYTKKLLENIGGANSITVVTVDFHIERSEYIFKKIFGPKTKIDFISSNTEYMSPETSRKHREYEAKTFATIKRILDDIKSGDERQVELIFDKMHPLYAKDPKTVPGEVWKAFESAGKNREWIIERYSKRKSKL